MARLKRQCCAFDDEDGRCRRRAMAKPIKMVGESAFFAEDEGWPEWVLVWLCTAHHPER